MTVLKTKEELKIYYKDFNSKNHTIGFVATMGALHEGHISLIEESKKENEITIASIFVNPTQFDKKEDLDNYPKTIEEDLHLLEKAKCDAVFIPSVEEVYKNNIASSHFDFDGLENEMEGEFRIGHFNGVGTVVKALFEIVMPTNAYFGEKDFQQLQIVRKMVKKNKMDVSVIGCPIYREENGLAMSSRNMRLTLEERKAAAIVYKVLKSVTQKSKSQSVITISAWVTTQFKDHPLFDLEYFKIADVDTLKSVSEILPNKQYRAFIAIYTNSVRLIDNLSINSELLFG
tara:strand:- start:11154 stop:12017 length:864 start_codon:yes stop_codon:yes gene_type:complete